MKTKDKQDNRTDEGNEWMIKKRNGTNEGGENVKRRVGKGKGRVVKKRI